jgi:hypothetical protein
LPNSKILARHCAQAIGNKEHNPRRKLSIDTSSVKTESFGGSKFWLLVVDDCTNVAWSGFLNEKKIPSGMTDKTQNISKIH